METQSRMKLPKGNVMSHSLPLDLTMEILKLLPVKTLIRFLSVSKLWASTIRSRYFMKLLLNVSLSRPKGLLFLFRHGYCGLVLSQNTHESSSFTTFQVSCHPPQLSTVSPSVHGLICYKQSTTRLVIYNPCTRRSITLPEIDTRRRSNDYYLGHDPIDNDYKALCIMSGSNHDLVKEIRVLTVGKDNSWRIIENSIIIPHAPFGREVCIRGVLYYQAFTRKKMSDLIIMSFDVRSEKFYSTKIPITLLRNIGTKLISYEGKLAAILVTETNVARLCVLEDAAKEEWSTKIVVLSTRVDPPIHWGGQYYTTETDTGEIIFAPHSLHASVLDLVYYDIKTNSAETVSMRGNTTDRTSYYTLSVSSNLVENLMFL
ncbi:unnamed protein product [Eruca vesicaria subsp. sativa]|uniref:F-box domain-containing protein n=1 Tax=Eruca vesicaria subsp. sativa TaxID=29727 RepID=A0ABC8LCU5_ERUVS|nr:unnamed protein product [Eruca vesicaria subsp. sativa]